MKKVGKICILVGGVILLLIVLPIFTYSLRHPAFDGKCPKCGSANVGRIIYGLPSELDIAYWDSVSGTFPTVEASIAFRRKAWLYNKIHDDSIEVARLQSIDARGKALEKMNNLIAEIDSLRKDTVYHLSPEDRQYIAGRRDGTIRLGGCVVGSDHHYCNACGYEW